MREGLPQVGEDAGGEGFEPRGIVALHLLGKPVELVFDLAKLGGVGGGVVEDAGADGVVELAAGGIVGGKLRAELELEDRRVAPVEPRGEGARDCGRRPVGHGVPRGCAEFGLGEELCGGDGGEPFADDVGCDGCALVFQERGAGGVEVVDVEVFAAELALVGGQGAPFVEQNEDGARRGTGEGTLDVVVQAGGGFFPLLVTEDGLDDGMGGDMAGDVLAREEERARGGCASRGEADDVLGVEIFGGIAEEVLQRGVADAGEDDATGFAKRRIAGSVGGAHTGGHGSEPGRRTHALLLGK